MSSQPPLRLKRAIAPVTKRGGNIVSVKPKPVVQQPGFSRTIPDASAAHFAPKQADPLAGHAFRAGLGMATKAAPRTVEFKKPSRQDIWAAGIGATRKSAALTIGYARAHAPDDAAFMQRFADRGCNEFRREARQGRGILRGVLAALEECKGTIVVESLGDIATPADLPRLIKELEGKGIAIITLDGSVDTKTVKGRAKLASQIVTAKALFGLRL